MKVFEFAKDVDMKPLELVELLRTLGISVRNHMSPLSDEELQIVQQHFSKESSKTAPAENSNSKLKKVVKKKAATTSTAKVETVKKNTTAEAKDTKTLTNQADEQEIKKSKILLRRKATKSKTSDEGLGIEDNQTIELNISPAAATDIAEENHGSQELTSQVVLDPASIVESEEVHTNRLEKEPVKKVVDTPRMHSFTPVFVPEKKVETSTSVPIVGKKPAKDLLEEDLTDEENKKRMGGLAQMVAKPKVASKNRDLSEMRSEEQMKQYAVGQVGKIIYSQVGKKKVFMGQKKQTEITQAKEHKRVIGVYQGLSAITLSQKLGEKFEDFANKVLDLKLLINPDDYLGIILANEIAELFDYRVESTAFDESTILGDADNVSNSETDVSVNTTAAKTKEAPTRPPIIAVMGHVDHGKTSLLDRIRKSKVADGEAGGITQHIGAYTVEASGKPLTFLDTPGHAAFAAMRSRGAHITDIVVLVVAADDGVMPQTKESIRFCKEAQVPIIVAVNKMDKQGASSDAIKQQLTEFELVAEEWGGTTQFAEVSAMTGAGIPDLLEKIQLQAEMMELTATPKGPAEAVIVEAKVEIGRGPIATAIIQKGTLQKGDFLVVGEVIGRARSLFNERGEVVSSAGPSLPVQILGLDEVPKPGDTLNVVKNEREAKKIVENRALIRLQSENSQLRRLEDFGRVDGLGMLKLVIRADVQGSFEAVKSALESLSTPEVIVQVIGGGVGAITDSDVQMCKSAEGFIIGFNMRPVTSARKLAENLGVDIKTYSIIYELIDDVKLALEGLLSPEKIEMYLGRAQVLQTFNIPKVGVVAGSKVIEGKIKDGCHIRLLRDGKIMFTGKMSTLKRFKESVKEVVQGLECGIGLENFNDIKVGDLFESFLIEEKKRTLAQSQGTAQGHAQL